ncbi:hypothetical protein D3C81_640850 [compost metagenome]
MQRVRIGRHGVGGLGRGRLGQAGQAVGKIIDAGVAAGTLGVFQAVLKQGAKGLVTGFGAFAIGILDQIRQGIDGRLPFLALSLGSIKGMCRGATLGLGTVLQREAQGWQVGQGVSIRIEGLLAGRLFRQCRGDLGLRRGRLQHGRHRLGLRLDQLCAGLGISDLTGHQAGITHTRISLGRILFWQLVAVIGNCSFASRVFLAAGCRIRFVLGLGLSNLVVLPGNLVAALLGHHLAKGIALVAQRLQRLVRLHGGRTRGLGNSIGLQQRVGCDRHRAVSAPETKIIGAETGKTRANSRISLRKYVAAHHGKSAAPRRIPCRCG